MSFSFRRGASLRLRRKRAGWGFIVGRGGGIVRDLFGWGDEMGWGRGGGWVVARGCFSLSLFRTMRETSLQ